MPNSYLSYTGNGSNRLFTAPSYISPAHISVLVNGGLVAFTWNNSSVVQVSGTPAPGDVVVVKRETPRISAPVDFQAGGLLKEADLDLLALTYLYILQEALDEAELRLGKDHTGHFNADNKRITDVANPTAAQDVVTRDYLHNDFASNLTAAEENAAASAAAALASEQAAAASETLAQASETGAELAAIVASASQSAASASESLASGHKDDAETAANAAAASESDAEAAAAAAESAKDTAVTAADNASTSETNAAASELAAAISASNAAAAETNAETAETNAETAETNAEAAQTAAEAAQTAAEAAQAAAEAALASLGQVAEVSGTPALGDGLVYNGSIWIPDNYAPRHNMVINGCCRVSQRGSIAASGSWQYGGADRILTALGGTGVSGTIANAAGAGPTSGYYHGVTGMGFTSGYAAFQTRLEKVDVLCLGGLTVTVSAKIYHDYGSAVTWTAQLLKPGAVDDHSSSSSLGSATTSVPSATATTVSLTLTLTAANVENGLGILFTHGNDLKTVSGKTCSIWDIQLRVGSLLLPFPVRHIAAEEDLCRRYYEYGTESGHVGGIYYTGYAQSNWVSFVTKKRATPTMALAGIALTNLGTNPSLANAYPRLNGFSPVFNVTGGTVGAAGQTYFSWTASCEL